MLLAVCCEYLICRPTLNCAVGTSRCIWPPASACIRLINEQLPLMYPEFMQAATDTELNKETKTINSF